MGCVNGQNYREPATLMLPADLIITNNMGGINLSTYQPGDQCKYITNCISIRIFI